MRIISIGFVISAVSTTASGALEGLGKGAESLVIALCRYVVFIMPLAALLCNWLNRFMNSRIKSSMYIIKISKYIRIA